MSEPLAYLNGAFVPRSAAQLPLHDAGFVWGATVTDLCRTFGRRLYRWADHLKRFRESCRLARVPLLLTDAELTDVAERLVAHNFSSELALVVFATPGPVPHYLGYGDIELRPTLGMHTFPLPLERYVRLWREGATLLVPGVRHLSARSVDPRIKQRSRLFWWIAEQEVHAVDPTASALLLDGDGFVTETAAANLLIVKDGRVQTPWRGRVLNGVSLQVVQELCGGLGIPFDEVDLSLADCRAANEALLSNTAYCLAPVRSLHGTTFPCPGPIFERLAQAWSEQLGVDFRS